MRETIQLFTTICRKYQIMSYTYEIKVLTSKKIYIYVYRKLTKTIKRLNFGTFNQGDQ